jgi:hypothetical protein
MTPKEEEITYTVASPDLWNRRQETGFSGIEIMIRAGLKGPRRAKHDRVAGWRALREYLTPYTDEQGILTAKLQIFDHCKHLIKNLPLLIHDENNPEDAADKPHDITHAPESCFIAGTLIKTDKGNIPIENIQPGDKVLTRDGYREVLESGVTSYNVPVYKTCFSNGSHFISTANHPIWVYGKGYVAVDRLRYGDIIEVVDCNKEATSICEKKSLSIKELHLQDTRIHQEGNAGYIIRHLVNTANKTLVDCIGRFGKMFTEKYRKDITFTIKTRIHSIMQLKTLNAYHTVNTYLNMELVLQPNTWPILDLLRQNGTVQRLVGISVGRIGTLALVNIWNIKLLNNAKNVVVNMRRLSQRQVNIVQMPVNQNTGEIQKKTTRNGYALSVENHSGLINMNRQKHVPENAVRVADIYQAGTGMVYNLMIKDTPEYYANGILVHNCRYGIMSRPRLSTEEKIEFPANATEADKQAILTNIKFADIYQQMRER